MNAQPQPTKKSLLRKLLQIGLISLFLLLCAVVGLGIFGLWYLGSDRVKTFENLAFVGGGSFSVGSITIADVWDYPEINLTVCDLHLWENELTHVDSAFFVMEEGRVRLRADLLNSDTILLREVIYNGGRLHIIKDDQNQDAIERMRGRRPEAQTNPRFLIVGSPKLNAGIHHVDFRFSNPYRGKEYAGFINRLDVSDLHLGKDRSAVLDFDIAMRGLTFKRSDGPFVKDTRLQGVLQYEHIGPLLSGRIPHLRADSTAIEFAASLYPNSDSISHLHFVLPSANMKSIRPMLSLGLKEKMNDYNVEGEFPAVVDFYRANEPGSKPEVHVEIKLRGNTARVAEHLFKSTYLNGTFINRLPAKIGDFTPDRNGSVFDIDTISANGFGFAFTTANASVISPTGQGSLINAKLHARGPASALSTLLKSDQYLFTKGEVEIDAALDGPLNEKTKLLDQSNGILRFTNPSIRLVDADVQLPLKHLTLDKQGNEANVKLEGVTLSEKHAFRIEGEVRGVSRIIGGANRDPVQSTVEVASPHLTWADLAAYLGTKVNEDTATLTDSTVYKGFDPVSLKKVLTSIETSFQPTLDVRVDTLSYLDVALTSFQTGMHFQTSDTLVLERTTFLLDTAKVGFGGSLSIGDLGKTTYRFSLNAKHVDVEELLPKVNYLGSELLAELKTLPNDVDIEIDQLGFIHDRDGILPNSSTGFIDLVSNKQKAFRARVDFEPDRSNEPAFNSTVVNIQGNASLFNDFFDTEEFLFQDGDFDFFMAYAGLIPDLRTLVENEEMSLDLRNGQVLFKSADLEIPINSLTLDMLRDTAEVRLFLRSEELGQELRVDGVANNLSEVVLGEAGKQFSTDASVVSERIVWKDLNALIGSFSGEKDTTVELNLRKTTRAIMMKFRPNVHLRIDELQLNNRLAILDVESGLRMDDNQRLHVDTTGFIYGNGSVKLAGSIDLKRLELTPFDLYLNTEELDLASLLEGFDHFGITSLKETETLEGKMSLGLNLDGDILGDGGNFVSETASGVMSFSFFDLQVDGLTQIDELAKRFKISNRLDNLKFAPVTNIVTLDTNTIHLPLMEIPSSAFRVFVEGDMSLGESMDFWVSVPLANLITPDSTAALKPIGYATHKFKVHVEFAKKGAEEDLETKLRLSRRKFYKQRQDLGTWKANRKYWKEERKRLRKAGKN